MAKAAVYPPFENPLQDALIIINYLTNPLQGFPEAPVVGLPNLVFAIALALGALHAFRHLEVIGAPLVWTAGLGLGYSVLNRYLFPWYLAPLFPMSLLLVTIGGVGILKASSVHWRPGFRRLYRLTAGAVCIAVVVGLGIEMLGAGLATKRDLAIREDGYARSGGWIGSHFGYGTEVAAVEVGALGYAYPGPIMDLTGLVTPASLPYYSAAKFSFSFPHDVPPELVTKLQPPVLVVFDGFIESLLATSAFRTSYCLVYSEPRTHHAYGRLLIFIRPAAFQGSTPLCQVMTQSIEPDGPWGQA
jgi:hypothetical protein